MIPEKIKEKFMLLALINVLKELNKEDIKKLELKELEKMFFKEYYTLIFIYIWNGGKLNEDKND